MTPKLDSGNSTQLLGLFPGLAERFYTEDLVFVVRARLRKEESIDCLFITAIVHEYEISH